MTRDQIKSAIRRGLPTPGVDRDLFESCYTEVMKHDHPTFTFTLKTLVESRSGERLGADGLPEGIHDRVAGMILRESREHPVSDLKDDSRFNAPRRSEYASDPRAAVAEAVANFLAHPETHPAAPKKTTPVTTLSEAQQLEKAIPDPIQRAYVILSGRARVGG